MCAELIEKKMGARFPPVVSLGGASARLPQVPAYLSIGTEVPRRLKPAPHLLLNHFCEPQSDSRPAIIVGRKWRRSPLPYDPQQKPPAPFPFHAATSECETPSTPT